IDIRGGVYIGKNEKWTHLPGTASENTDHEALVNEWTAFVDAVGMNSPPPITGSYGKHIMEIVFAARESSLHNKEIWI
ncbi:MAG: hypothetical protein KAT15_07325, partial [Bacteroidales bacterium]|nr:hypothetical protein [Bacteroidales bacterium]